MVGASGHGKELIQVQHATVRFAGDSGDGMQLVGGQFADIASMSGSAICSFPDFPSDIRAPAGTLGGVSGYQLSFGDQRVTTPGDAPFVLVAMNPAALKVCLPELQEGGIIIANEDAFTPANLQKAEYDANPLEDGSLDDYRLIPVPMGRLTDEATAATGLPKSQRDRCKNFFALVVEGNCGQLKMILRDRFTASFFSLNQVAGRPFLIREVRTAIQELLDREHHDR